MPELPEVESARAVIEQRALHRRIAAVDDTDSYECRPHAPGELSSALSGRSLTAAHRRGKLLWCETSAHGRSKRPGPLLAIHLGMSGRILVRTSGGAQHEGGDYPGPAGSARATSYKPAWDRFTLTFTDGGELRLRDKRRLGRVYLEPDIEALGPDAGEISVGQFRDLLGRGAAPIKARMMNQNVIAGVGNLLADEALWRAAVDPAKPAGELDREELTRLHRGLRAALRTAIKHGGVHAGRIVEHRVPGGTCPRCGATMKRSTVGGRTTWFCSAEQT